jgi:lipid-A-disaccharide synthase
MPLIHYVAPMVWAWRAKNAEKIGRWYDHLLALLPFEPPYFAAVGMPCTHVGHPVVESGADRGDGPGFRARHGIAQERAVLAVLPGSRGGELKRLLPIFAETVQRLRERRGDLAIVMPTIDMLAERLKQATSAWPVRPIIVTGKAEKYDAFAASDAALAASGTVALELAMAGVPMVVAYRLSPVSALLSRYLVKARFANLINLILDRPAVPELLLERCTPALLSQAVEDLLTSPAARGAQRAAFKEALAQLGYGGVSPSLRAAEIVLSVLAQAQRGS